MKRFAEPKLILIAYLAVAAVISVQKLHLGGKESDGRIYTQYNNFVIFRSASVHLLEHQDLYQRYPDDHWDLFKYSPTFALAAVPFAWLPDGAGLLLWNVVNAALLFMALALLPIRRAGLALVLWLTLKELSTSLHNAQSNGLVAALMILVFVLLERERPQWAALCAASVFFIKVFGIAAVMLAVFYPHQRRFLGWLALWMLVLGAAPLVVLSPQELVAQYQSWMQMLRADHAAVCGLSVIGVLHTWFGLEAHKGAVVLVGGGLLLLPLLVGQPSMLRGEPLSRSEPFVAPVRLAYLSALLIWVVIFNHRAESPTFVIAMCGVWIWYVTSKQTRWDTALAVFAFLGTSMSGTDLFPRSVRAVFTAYQLKAIPCILVWAKLMFDLCAARLTGSQSPDTQSPNTALPLPEKQRLRRRNTAGQVVA